MAKNKEPIKVLTRDVSEEDALKALELTRKAVTKTYGDVIHKLSDHSDMAIPTLSTGCLSLDLALGNGGFGFGRPYEIFGAASSGKTTLCVSAIIQAQRRGFRACYIDAENAVDPNLFRLYGVDAEKMDLVQAYDGEGCLDILEKLVKTGAFKVAVIDSIAALLPRQEAEAEMQEQQMGLQARLIGKAMRKIIPVANQTGTILLFINQMRTNLGGYGNPMKTAGGEATPYYMSARISVKGPEAVARRLKEEHTGAIIGHKTEFEIAKNKLSVPFRTANINLYYGVGYDTYSELISMATDVGVIDKMGAWYKYNGESFAQGEVKAIEFLKAPENIEIYKTIKEEVIERSGLKEIYEKHSNPGAL